MERWSPIPDWPLYDISDHGNVRSWAPNYRHKANGRRKLPVERKTVIAKRGGYRMVALCLRDKGIKKLKTFYVHRLVATCFVDGRAEGLDVAHLDGSRTNNHYSNLLWCTRKVNESHKDIHGTRPEGETHSSTEICDKGVFAIRRLYEIGFSLTEIAFVFEMGVPTISGFVSGKTRKYLKLKPIRRQGAAS